MRFNSYGFFGAFGAGLIAPSRDWSAVYKQMLSYMPVSSLYNVRANAAREGVVLDAQGNVMGTLDVYASPSTDELASLAASGNWSVQSVAKLLASTADALAKAVAEQTALAAQNGSTGEVQRGAATLAMLAQQAGTTVAPVLAQQAAPLRSAAAAVEAAGGGNPLAAGTMLPDGAIQPVTHPTGGVTPLVTVAADGTATLVAPATQAPAGAAQKSGWLGAALAGGVPGFFVGGPIGAAVGAVAGAVLLRKKS